MPHKDIQELIELLDSLLSITEPMVDDMDAEDRVEWQRISARTADIQAGDLEA